MQVYDEREVTIMGIANKYNKVNLFEFTIPKDFEYRSLHDLFNDNGKDFVYEVRALYINKKSKFGESPIVATNQYLVNLPKHMTDTVKEMMRDEEFVNAVNSGTIGFTIYTYETKNRAELCYSVNWVDR